MTLFLSGVGGGFARAAIAGAGISVTSGPSKDDGWVENGGVRPKAFAFCSISAEKVG